MKNIQLMKRMAILLASLILVSLTGIANTADEPSKVIAQVADDFIGALKQETISTDEVKAKEQIKNIVDKHLSPAIDFRRIAYRTMGKYYKQASTEQFLNFEQSIKKSLINTYANPLLGSNSQQLANKISIEIRESKINGKNNDKAIIASWLKVGVNEKYDVIYYMYLKKSQDKWLVENVAVEGINLSISFRNQFQRLHTEYNGDFDKISQVWAKSNVAE